MNSASPASERRRLPSIRRALLLRFTALIIIAFAIFAVGLYFMIVRPAAHDIAAGEMRRVATEVDAEFRDLVGQADRLLSTARGWARSGEFDLFNVAGFNRLFMPVLESRPLLSSAYVTDGEGRQVLLERGADGAWANRLADPRNWGTKRRQMSWRESGAPVRDAELFGTAIRRPGR